MNGEAVIPDKAAMPETPPSPADRRALPAIFVDAGDEPWSELEPLLRKELGDLLPGNVLEVQSGDPATIMTLPGWCAGEGHTLLHAQPGDGHVSFWIGKNA